MRTILVVAGNAIQAESWIRKQPKSPNIRYNYTTGQDSVKGFPDTTTYALVGTYYEHPHYPDIMDEIDRRMLERE